MNSSDLLEVAIIAFIAIGIAVAIWKGGARNPVGTGGLDKRLTEFGGALAGVEGKVGEIEDRIEQIERVAANKEDIDRMEERLERRIKSISSALPDLEARQHAMSDRLAEHATRAAVTAKTVEHVGQQVDRMYSVLVPKGMTK